MQQEREAQSKEQQVDPWTVRAAEGEATINYDKLIGIMHAPVRKCVPKVNIFIAQINSAANVLTRLWWLESRLSQRIPLIIFCAEECSSRTGDLSTHVHNPT